MASTIIQNPYSPPITEAFALADYVDTSGSFSNYSPCSSVWGDNIFSYNTKAFAPSVYTTSSLFSYNTTNVASIDYVRAEVNGHTALIRMRTYIQSSMTDTALAIGSFKWSYIGISSFNTTMYIPATTDGGNAFIMGYLNNGSLQITDVVTKTTATSVAASSGSQKRVDWQFAIPINTSSMIDSACRVGWYERI